MNYINNNSEERNYMGRRLRWSIIVNVVDSFHCCHTNYLPHHVYLKLESFATFKQKLCSSVRADDLGLSVEANREAFKGDS